jgi:aspartyl-tRNA(Asn)/glutamyl-tRNA(Gln) amidotransferase subunit A
VRQPASFCGIVGVKPTYGRCSRQGIVAFASSLDQAGILARSVEDSAILLEAISGYDTRDATSKNIPVPEWSKSVQGGVKGLNVGIPKEYLVDGMPEEIIKIWEDGKRWLQDAGAIIVDISMPHSQYALPAYYIIAPGEASSNLARFDGVRYGYRADDTGLDILEMIAATRAEGFGKEVKRRIMIGTYLLSSGQYSEYYLKAQKVRRLVWQDFIDAFEKVDVILAPTTPSTAFPFGENSDNPIKMYLTDVLTVTLNLAGLPGISVPAGLGSNGLPLGLQVMGKPFDEETMFKTAFQIEQYAQFKGL